MDAVAARLLNARLTRKVTGSARDAVVTRARSFEH